MLMIENFLAAKKLIEQSQNILLTMHERMDGDDGGSVLAMAGLLESLGKTVTCAIKRGVPPSLSFLPGIEKISDDIIYDQFDLAIFFGCATKGRTGSEKIQNLNTVTINIDHHPDNSFFGHINIVDHNKSSVAELVYDMFIANKWDINKDTATCLLTGLITDTGSFMHSNTKSSTLKTAGELMKKGARSSKIIKHTFKNKNLNSLKAWGRAIENSYYDGKRKIIFSMMTEKDFSDIGLLPPATFEGFVETLNTIPEAKFALFLRQEGELIKGSLRSRVEKNTDVAKIAKIFGGGGHRQAAGFAVLGKLEKDEQGKWKVA